MTKQTTVPAPDVLRAHALDLARAFNARVVESSQLRPDEALAVAGMRVVFCSSIIDETTYAVTLHELGHLASPTGVLRNVVAPTDRAALMRDEEDAAWTWARHYALVWTPVMDAVASWAEGTYAAPTRPTAPAPLPADRGTVPPPNAINWKDWK